MSTHNNFIDLTGSDDECNDRIGSAVCLTVITISDDDIDVQDHAQQVNYYN